jgi:hypothetical protein
MATTDKDFKVKNGIQVAGDATIVGTLTAATPTTSTHVTTKAYVDALIASAGSGVEVSSTPPSSPSDGDLWFDTIVSRLNVSYNSTWLTIATIDDTLNLPDHIHDTSIDGNGLIVTTFVDAGTIYEPQGTGADAGTAETTDWSETWSGGIATDNFN